MNQLPKVLLLDDNPANATPAREALAGGRFPDHSSQRLRHFVGVLNFLRNLLSSDF